MLFEVVDGGVVEEQDVGVDDEQLLGGVSHEPSWGSRETGRRQRIDGPAGLLAVGGSAWPGVRSGQRRGSERRTPATPSNVTSHDLECK